MNLRTMWIAAMAAAALLLASCAGGQTYGGGQEAAPEGDIAENEVVMRNTAFNPSTLTVSAGTTVTWMNEDGFAHTVTADNGEFDSGDIASGGSFSHTFDEPGTYPYSCTIHPSMQGAVEVSGG